MQGVDSRLPERPVQDGLVVENTSDSLKFPQPWRRFTAKPNSYWRAERMDRTFVMFKPDCLERGLVGRILSRFEEKGLRLVAMKMLRVTPALARQHYAEHVEKPFYHSLEEFITAAPVVATVFSGPEVIRVVRDMLGATSGLNALPGTIRGDHSSSRQMNHVHASDSLESAKREIGIYFTPSDMHDWDPALACWLQAPSEA